MTWPTSNTNPRKVCGSKDACPKKAFKDCFKRNLPQNSFHNYTILAFEQLKIYPLLVFTIQKQQEIFEMEMIDISVFKQEVQDSITF